MKFRIVEAMVGKIRFSFSTEKIRKYVIQKRVYLFWFIPIGWIEYPVNGASEYFDFESAESSLKIYLEKRKPMKIGRVINVYSV